MQSGDPALARAEWQAHWPLTLASMLGYSAIALQSYGISPFVTALEAEFGWSRAQVMAGVSVSTLLGIGLNLVIGTVIDRFGSRRIAILGLLMITGSFALLGTATGTQANWALLWVAMAFGTVLVQSTVWTRAIASRFDAARGTALAVALSGTPIASMFIPALAQWLTRDLGWRLAFAGMGAIWLVLALPAVLRWFHEAPTIRPIAGAAAPAPAPGLTLRQGIATRAFACLAVSFGCFSFYSFTIATNLVPLLSEAGATSVASLAFLMGLIGIAARLTVGMLLDRFPGNLIGVGTLLIPLIGCAILLGGKPDALLLGVAVASFGAAIGAEVDVALYLATRHFGLRAFAALFGAVIGFGALMATAGPYIAGRIHDVTGDYRMLLIIIMAVMATGALAIGLIGRKVPDWGAAAER